MYTIGSSLICMDHINFKKDIELVKTLQIDYVHIDVMDGLAVPRYGIYPEIVRNISEFTDINMDLHLMVADVEFALSQFKNISNIKYVSFHLDKNWENIARISDCIRKHKFRPVGILNLSTHPESILELLENNYFDGLMFMGIHPGVLKQDHRPDVVIKKINKLSKNYDLKKLSIIQCDGGVNFETLKPLYNSGVTNFVCGTSTLYKNIDFRESRDVVDEKISINLKKIRAIIEN